MKHYVTSSVRVLSLLTGVVLFLASWGILALAGVPHPLSWGAITGAAGALLVAVVLALMLWTSDLRYRDVEKEIGETVHVSVSANVTVDNASRNGYLYLTADSLLCYFRDHKPYTRVAFSRDPDRVVRELSPVALEITDAGHSFEIVSADCEMLARTMRTHGWTVIPCWTEDTSED